MFTLAISCLTTSNLPLFMDLTFQVPTWYGSLKCQTFTTRHIHNWKSFSLCPSCFLLSATIGNCPLLFPSSILDTFRPGRLIFWCHIFLPFLTVHGILQARTLEWFAIPSSSGPCFVRTPHYDPSVGWSCTAWLIASSSSASPYAMTGMWSMKESVTIHGYKIIFLVKITFFLFICRSTVDLQCLSISAAQQSDSVLYTHTHIYIFNTFPLWFIVMRTASNFQIYSSIINSSHHGVCYIPITIL